MTFYYFIAVSDCAYISFLFFLFFSFLSSLFFPPFFPSSVYSLLLSSPSFDRLDSFPGTEKSRPLRKEQVKSIQRLLDQMDTVKASLKDIHSSLQDEVQKEEEKERQRKAEEDAKKEAEAKKNYGILSVEIHSHPSLVMLSTVKSIVSFLSSIVILLISCLFVHLINYLFI